ncbi:MAG: polymerase [Chloroflexi bacterium]|nr:polymerase [Chloroflexota bacterium]
MAQPSAEPPSETDERAGLAFTEDQAMEHVDALYRTALRMTRNPADAEDLVQETYLRAFRFRDRFIPGSNLRAWLFKILSNASISRFRHSGHDMANTSLDEMEDFDLFAHSASQVSAEGSAEDEALGQILDIDVRQALEELPEPFRLAVLLSDVEGFSYREVADMLDVPLGTVMSRLFRGRRILRRELQEYAAPIMQSAAQA